MWCWGYNGYGQLGNGGTGTRLAPAQVGSTDELYFTDAKAIRYHGNEVCTALALKKDGSLYSWGYSGHGQCGYGGTSDQYKAIAVQDPNAKPMKDVRSIHTTKGSRYGSLCAITNDGTAYCWGYNNHGQVGDGTTSTRTRPVKVSTITDVEWIEAAPLYDHSYAYHTNCARLKDGTVWCWGFGNYGQGGWGDTGERQAPNMVKTITNIGKLYARGWHASSGDSTFYAVSRDGFQVWAWGYSGHSQLGEAVEYQGSNWVPHPVRLGRY